MEPTDGLRAAIGATTNSARAFAAMIGSDERTVRRWLAGDRNIPGPVLTLCRLLVAYPGMVAPSRMVGKLDRSTQEWVIVLHFEVNGQAWDTEVRRPAYRRKAV